MNIQQLTGFFVRGLAMGAANVIPGVSGGTIALITGIFERLINALKSCDHVALGHLLHGRLRALSNHIDASFLLALLTGVATSIISLARVLEHLLSTFEVETMSFFFGLILLSVLFVGRSVHRWSAISLVSLLIGTAIAAGIALLAPLQEDASFWYLILCGVVAICSMILPGLSGSFVLIIMGNYALVLGAVSRFDLSVIIPLAIGCGVGLLAFSHFLAWVFRRHHDATVALMTGFILGSLLVIWPWKQALTSLVQTPGREVRDVVIGYQWFMPDVYNKETLLAGALMLCGALVIIVMEWFAEADQRTVPSDD